MKTILKTLSKSLLILALGCASVMAQINSPSPTYNFTVASNFSSAQTPGYFTLYTNAAKISSITIIGGSAASYINLYDNNVTNSTYTNGVYSNQVSYVSNVVTSYVSPLTGMTNTQTNSQLVTAWVSVAAGTNPLPYNTYAAPAGLGATYNINRLISRGISMYVSTNCTVVVNYRVND